MPANTFNTYVFGGTTNLTTEDIKIMSYVGNSNGIITPKDSYLHSLHDYYRASRDILFTYQPSVENNNRGFVFSLTPQSMGGSPRANISFDNFVNALSNLLKSKLPSGTNCVSINYIISQP